MYINNIKIKKCVSFKSRLIGLMFKKNINYGLYFPNCNSIHTFFMCENIDVIMWNNDNIILYYYKNLGKNKIILPKKGVKNIYELPKNSINDLKINDILKST